MEGLLMFQPTSVVVGKKSEYKSKPKFLLAALDENDGYNFVFKKKYGRVPSEDDVYSALVRYFPKGTENSEIEFGKGEGVYQFVDKATKGVFEVWCL